jgi:hypothetical protein
VLSAALESRRRHIPGNADCSHLVHNIYERAGFIYPYASSTDLYEGVDSFKQVNRPQPGDLVVWRGHVGLVINPAQHTFFSALRSGRGVEKYDSKYWKGRGKPHFFRYVKATPPRVLAAKTEVANLTPPAIVSIASEDSAVAVSDPPASGDRTLDVPPPALPTAELQPPSIPRVQLINSAKPTPAEVRDALLSTFNSTGEALRGRDVFKLSQSLIVFDSFEVRKIHLSGDVGWAEVRISGPSSVKAGHANLKKHSERQRWVLVRRDRISWELTLPADTIYLPRAVAVRVLAQQLAALAGTGTVPAPPHDKKTQLARLIDVLLEQPPSP